MIRHFVAWLTAASMLAPLAVTAQIAPPPREEEEEAPRQPQLTKAPELVRFVNADYPEAALDAGTTATVRLWVDIAADGRVANAEVIEPVGDGFDEAALAAVRQFLFSPAEFDGEPRAVRVEYAYNFTIDVEEVEVEPELEDPAEEPREPKIEGRLYELGTPNRIPGEAVYLVETGETEITDDRGRFTFYDVPPGPVTLQVPEGVFLETSLAVTVPEEGSIEVDLRAKPDPDAEFSTLVRGEETRSEPQRRDISIKEATKIAGSNGDPIRALQNLPSVARSPGLAGILIVRGSNPNDSRFLVDGQLLPQLYHFGGLYSTIPAEFIDEISFYPGGFSSMYGDATGGLVQVSLKENRYDRWSGQVDINVFHAAGYAEGPVWEGGSLSLGFRRSYIDAIIPAVTAGADLSFNTAPVYYDYQLKLDQKLGDRNHLRFFVYGSDDQLRLLLEEVNDDEPEIQGNFENHSYYHLGTVWWEHTFNQDVELVSSLATGGQLIEFRAGDFLDLSLDLFDVSWREDLKWRISDQLTILAGIDADADFGKVEVTGPLPPQEGEVDVPLSSQETFETDRNVYFGRGALYLEAVVRPVPSFIFTIGSRFESYWGDWSAEVMAPRASFRWQVAESTTLKGGAGFYYRRPDFNQLDTSFGNPNLKPERALQTSFGIEQTLYEGLTADVQGFYKFIDDLVRPTSTQVEGQQYDNGGLGRAYGFEVLLRQQLGKFFWGWASYTFTVAERKDGSGEPWRPFDFDQTHVLTLVSSFRIPWDIELSARFRYVTGNPETPVVGSFFDADAGVYQQLPGEINSSRVPDFHQLDIRIDKTWLFDAWTLVTYIEVQNSYNRMNPEGFQYNYNYTDRSIVSGLPIIPGFGVTGKF